MVVANSACNYTKPGMYITINNQSGKTIRNLEVQYPGGIYGLPTLGDDQSNRRLVQVTPPCKFVVKFDEDPSVEPHAYQFGEPCPKEITFTIGRDFAQFSMGTRP